MRVCGRASLAFAYTPVFCVQVGHGRCRVEKLIEGHAKVLGGIAQQETFGEISFLQGEGATASVIADEDTVCCYTARCASGTDAECAGGDLRDRRCRHLEAV